MAGTASSIAWRTEGDVTIVRFKEDEPSEEVFSTQAPAEFKKLIAETGGGKVLLSLANVKHVSSSGVTALLSFEQTVRSSGGVFKVSDLQSEVDQMFDLARLSRVFDLYKTKEDAIAAFGEE